MARYPRLQTDLPTHLHARLQAASIVLEEPVAVIMERALERELSRLSDEQREVADRIAVSLVQTSDL